MITKSRHADPLPVLVKTDPDAEPRHRGMSIFLVEQGTRLYRSRAISASSATGAETCEVVLDEYGFRSTACSGASKAAACNRRLSALNVARITSRLARWRAAEATGTGIALHQLTSRLRQPIAQFQALQLNWPHGDERPSSAAHDLLGRDQSTRDKARRRTAWPQLFASETAVTCALDRCACTVPTDPTELDIERLYRDAPLDGHR